MKRAEGRRSPGPKPVALVAPSEVLAKAAGEIATRVEPAVLSEGKRLDQQLATELRRRRDLSPIDGHFISAAVFSLFRWKGWLDPLRARSIEERLLLASLLDAPRVHPVCRLWARQAGRDPEGLVALGDAPDWKARSEGFRKLVGGGRAVMADPWRLFPPWLREHLPLPPGDEPVARRLVALLESLQAPPSLWVRAQGDDPERVWEELRGAGARPWVHRRVTAAAKLGPDVDVYHLAAFERGALEIQDIASQSVGLVCDPDPGERWWDACAGAGGKALHLAALMSGKGTVIATDRHDRRLKETVRRARRSPFRNLSTRLWDGKHVVGKPGSYHGVLVDAPCSAIGTWRRNPEARWSLDPAAIRRLAESQRVLLEVAARGVRPGGRLVYSVCTLTPLETTQVLAGFRESHPEFQWDPFPHPLTGQPTPGHVLIWPREADSDAMFVARLIRAT